MKTKNVIKKRKERLNVNAQDLKKKGVTIRSTKKVKKKKKELKKVSALKKEDSETTTQNEIRLGAN